MPSSLSSLRPPARGFGAGPVGVRRRSPPTGLPLGWRIALGALFVAAASSVGAWALLEARIQVIADDHDVYVHQLPKATGSEVRYRFSSADPFVPTSPHEQPDYYATVPLPRDRRPARGKVPFEIEYRTFFGLTRTKWPALDVDAEQVRELEMQAASGGHHGRQRPPPQ